MVDMKGLSNSSQFGEMIQKFAVAFRTKTIEFFAEEEEETAPDGDGFCDFLLLDSTEEYIPNQKVVVVKPSSYSSNQNLALTQPFDVDQPESTASATLINLGKHSINRKITDALITSIFVTFSAFNCSYLQFQSFHDPFDDEGIRTADLAIISHFRKFADIRSCCCNIKHWDDSNIDATLNSCMDLQVEENQITLRALEILVNRLQSDIDDKNHQVSVLRKELAEINKSNSILAEKINDLPILTSQGLLSVRVFDYMLLDACGCMEKFSKLVIRLMNKAGWDPEQALHSLQNDFSFTRKEHIKYVFLSYVCSAMFQDFDLKGFGVDEPLECGDPDSLRLLIKHLSVDSVITLSRDQNNDFSKFCECKYQKIVNLIMESPLSRNIKEVKTLLQEWRSMITFYEAFVYMVSSIWVLQKLAHSFYPIVEVFWVDNGAKFSLIHMVDMENKYEVPHESMPQVSFTVFPGFNFGKTVIPCQVYLHRYNE